MAMKVVGLVGGVASGKSAVARWLAQWGAGVIDADRLAHEVLEDPAVLQALAHRWGPELLEVDGPERRQWIASRVFGPHREACRERAFLEGVLHPRIRAQAVARIEACQDEGRSVCVLDAPLLLEAGWDSLCDEVLWIDAPREQRLQRAMARGWTEKQFTAREDAQLPIEEKRKRCTRELENRGSLQDLRNVLCDFWKQWGGNPQVCPGDSPNHPKV